MNFLKKWLNWKVVGMLSFLVLSFLVAGWIWHRNGVVTRHEELRESVESMVEKRILIREVLKLSAG